VSHFPATVRIRAAAREYAEEVRQGRFPAAAHIYSR
jgi:ketopantoate hydroxymethyltransferase